MEIPGIYNPVTETEKPKSNLSEKDMNQLKNLTDALQPGANLKVRLDNTQVTTETKEKGHKTGRMKVTFKLGKNEVAAFNLICNAFKPNNISNDEFIKLLVFKGLDVYQKELNERVEKFKKEHPDEFAKLAAETVEESSIEPLPEDPKPQIL